MFLPKILRLLEERQLMQPYNQKENKHFFPSYIKMSTDLRPSALAQWLSIPGRSFRSPDPTASFRKEAGKILVSRRKTPKITGIGSSIPVEKRWDFFRQIPINFLCFPTGIGQNLSEKVRKYPIGILLPKKPVELHGNGRFQAGLFHMG